MNSIILLSLGFFIYWLTDVLSVTSRKKKNFSFALYIHYQLLQIIISALCGVAVYFMLPEISLMFNFRFEEYKNTFTILAGYGNTSLFRKLISITQSKLK